MIDANQVLNLLVQELRQQVLNIYVFGSRLYGTNNERSDWDVVVVIQSRYRTSTTTNTICDEQDETMYPETLNFTVSDTLVIDIQLVDLSEMQSTMNRDFVLDELMCLWVQPEYILLENHVFPQTWNIDPLLFEQAIVKQVNKLLISAEISIEHSVYHAKKKILLLIIYLDLATQIVKNGRIIDFRSIPKQYHELIHQTNVDIEDWDQLSDLYGPIVDEFREAFLQSIRNVPSSLIKLVR
jgi:predicted nucleotidyltransferase